MITLNPAPTIMSPASVQDLIWVCSTLCRLLDVENKALETHDADAAQVVAEERSNLTRLYSETYQALGQEKGITKILTPPDMTELLRLGHRLDRLRSFNARLKAQEEHA